MPEMNPSESIRITDLTLAAYLCLSGFEPTLSENGQSHKGVKLGAWEFDSTAGVRQRIEYFEAGHGKVEPRKFHQALTRTRRSMLEYLGES
jgi:hypothetical protein